MASPRVLRLVGLLPRRATGAAVAAGAALPALACKLLSLSSHEVAAFAPPAITRSLVVGLPPPSGPQHVRGFAASASAVAVAPAVQVGDVLDARVTEVSEAGLRVSCGQELNTLYFVPRRNISKVKMPQPLSEVFMTGEDVKVLVVGKRSDGEMYLSMRHFEEEPGSIVKDKQAVFARAQQAANQFKEEGVQKLRVRQEFIHSVSHGAGPFEAKVLGLRHKGSQVVILINGVIFTSFVTSAHITKEAAVQGQTIQVWCIGKTKSGLPKWSMKPPPAAVAPVAPATALTA